MIERAAIAADLGIKAHAHMLRHACGYKLANDGHDTRAIQAYLGHRNIQNMTRYTALVAAAVQEIFSRLTRPQIRTVSGRAHIVRTSKLGPGLRNGGVTQPKT
jgi:integrase